MSEKIFSFLIRIRKTGERMLEKLDERGFMGYAPDVLNIEV